MKLIITEKEYMATDIIDYLCKKYNYKIIDKDNYVEIIGNYYITWCKGHLLKYYEPQDYDFNLAQWKIDDLPIIPQKFKLRPIKNKTKKGRKTIEVSNPYVDKQLETIKILIEKSNSIIHAGDAGREGQIIVDEILEYFNNYKPVERLWLNGLSFEEIDKGFNSLLNNQSKHNLSQAGTLRAEMDWIFGTNLSRAMTLKFKECGLTNTFSVGRGQTPILKILYDRMEARKNFVPEEYYNFYVGIKLKNSTVKLTLKQTSLDKKFLNSDGYITDKKYVLNIGSLLNGKKISLLNFNEKKYLKQSELLNLTILQEQLNSSHFFSAKKTMDLAQSLYEKKLISYPRTSCQFLPKSEWINIVKLMKDLEFYNIIEKNIKIEISKSFDDYKLNDHHALIPIQFSIEEYYKLSDDEKVVYNYILNKLLDNIKITTPEIIYNVNYSIEDSNIILKGIVSKNEFLELKTQDGFYLYNNIHTEKKMTEAPPNYTEGSLLYEMRNINDYIIKNQNLTFNTMKMIIGYKNGLGTDATRTPLIENLKSKSFIKSIQNTNFIEITDKGIELINNLKNMDLEEIYSPILTVKFENLFNKIENGEIKPQLLKTEINTFIDRNIKKIKTKNIILSTNYYKK